MYTVLWTDWKGNDRWERCSTQDEVDALLDRENIRDADTLIFLPDADDFSVDGEEFNSSI